MKKYHFFMMVSVVALLSCLSCFAQSSAGEMRFAYKWGSMGTGDGQFKFPFGIFYDKEGLISTCDVLNNRVQVFTTNGAFVRKWGSGGSGDGQINNLYGFCLSTNDLIYVADTMNNRIQVFTTNGVFVRKWGSGGSGDGQYNNPSSVKLGPDELVYVVDTLNNRIQVFQTNGLFVRKWGVLGVGDGQFNNPRSIAFDKEGLLYVNDSQNNRVQVFQTNGAFLSKWGAEGSGDGQFKTPMDITVGTDGLVYVADHVNYRVQVFQTNGVFVRKWGSFGSGDGQFSGVAGITQDKNGLVFVADSNAHRIQVFQWVGNAITVLTDRVGISVPEGGITNFQVKLSSQPTGAVLVAVARVSGDGDIAPIVGSNLIFSTTNWAAYQTVTLAAAEDNGDNVNGTAGISCSSPGMTNATVQAVEVDDDYTLGVLAVNGTVTKAPDTPYHDSGSSVALTAVQKAGYHFTSWSGAATGTNNPVNLTVSNTTSVTANFVLNVVTILTDRASISIHEGSATNFQVKLSAQPTGAVVVVAGPSGDVDISVSGGASKTFSTTNWNTYQTVTLVAAEDNGDNVNGVATVILNGAGVTNAAVQVGEIDDDHVLGVSVVNGTVQMNPERPYYDNGASVSLTAIQNAGYHFTGWSGDATGTNNPVNLIVTNDMSVTANFGLNAITVLTDRASVSVPEGGVTNFYLKLSAQPTGETGVAVAWMVGDADITISAGSILIFTTNTWDVFQTATLAAGEDDADDLNGEATVTCSGVDITNAIITAAEIDDDYTLTVTAINGAVAKIPAATLYDSGTTVSLDAMPSVGYHFTGWSGAATGATNPISVMVDDDKDVTATFELNVITVLTDRASVAVPEGVSTNFQVKLSAQPTGDTVVVTARTAGDTDIAVSGGESMTFTTGTWANYQTVALSAGEDNSDNLNGIAIITCSGSGISNAFVETTEIDDEYSLTVTATNGTVAKNPDAALYDKGTAVTLTASGNAGYHFTGWSGDATGEVNPVVVTMDADSSVAASFALNVVAVLTDRAVVTVPEGESCTFQVKLSAQPTGDTVVAVARTAGDPDISVREGERLTFSTANWTDYQAVSLSAAEDNGDNGNGDATITCSADGVSSATVDAIETDDDFILGVDSPYGAVKREPDTPFYDNGTVVTLTASPDPSYFFTEWTGDLIDTNNPSSIPMDGNKSVSAFFGPTMPYVLPPAKIAKKTFTARWKWVEGGAPEGELSVVLQVGGFPQYVPGYWNRDVNNSTDCVVTNLLADQDYWYRIRRIMPDGSVGPWSPQMKVRTGKGLPVFKNLLSDVPVSKGVSQEFAISDLMTGAGTLKVKSSNANAVNAVLSEESLTLQYLWKDTNTAASVTLTLVHPATGYKASYAANVSRAGGSVAIVGQSGITNADAVVAQEVTLENRTGGMVYGVRLRVLGLDQPAWLINQTGLDPVSKAAIREIPCVWPADSLMVVRLVYSVAYKKQAKTRPAAYGASAIMPPMNGALPVNGDMTITQKNPYEGLWLLGLPVDRNRLYMVYHSDDDGASWTLNAPLIRATANYLMWLDTDTGAPANRLYRVMDAGL